MTSARTFDGDSRTRSRSARAPGGRSRSRPIGSIDREPTGLDSWPPHAEGLDLHKEADIDVRTRRGKEQGHCPRCDKWRALTKEWWVSEPHDRRLHAAVSFVPVGVGRGVARNSEARSERAQVACSIPM